MHISIRIAVIQTLPLLIGVIVSFILNHFTLQSDLQDWSNQSDKWLKFNQQRQIENLVFANKKIIEINLQGIANGIQALESFYHQFDEDRVIINEGYLPIACSSYDYDNQNCTQLENDASKQNELYLDQWFHRDATKYNQLSDLDKSYYRKSIPFMFLAKVIQNSAKKDLLSIYRIYQIFDTSLMTMIPSKTLNFKESPRLTCIDQKGLQNYDPRCRFWYQQTIINQYNEFTEPYLSTQSKTIISSISKKIPINQGKNNSMIAFFVTFQNFMDNILNFQDQSQRLLDSKGYNVLMHSLNGIVLYHKDWDRWDGLKLNWTQVEYKKFNDTESQKQEADNFNSKLRTSLTASKQGQHTLLSGEVDQKFSFEFTKDGQNYFSTLFPVEFLTLNRMQGTHIQNPLMIGRVETDMHLVILKQSLEFNSLHLYLSISGISLVVLILFLSGIHLTAVLNRSIDIPIELLSQFITCQDFNIQHLQEQQQPVLSNRPPLEDINSFATPILSRKPNTSLSPLLSRTVNPRPTRHFKQQQFRLTQDLMVKSIDIPLAQSTSNSNENILFPKRDIRINSDRGDLFTNRPLATSYRTRGGGSNSTGGGIRSIKFRLNEYLDLSTKRETEYSEDPNYPTLVNLEDIQSRFQEMNIIIQVFQKMENVIKLAKSADVTGDSDNSLINYSTLNQMLKISVNEQGMSKCYTRIGILFLKKQAYTEAIQNLEIAVILTLNTFHIPSINEFELRFFSGFLILDLSQANQLVFRLRVYSLALLLAGRYLKENSQYNQLKSIDQSNQLLSNAKQHAILAKRIIERCIGIQSEEMDMIALIIIEIEIEEQNYQYSQALLSSIVIHDHSSWITNYVIFLQGKIELQKIHEYELDEASQAIIRLTSVIENSRFFDAYLMQNTMCVLDSMIYNVKRCANRADLTAEMQQFKNKAFDFYFVINSSENEDVILTYQNIIRSIINEFCQDFDTFSFLKFSCEGVCALETKKIKDRDHLENCMGEILRVNATYPSLLNNGCKLTSTQTLLKMMNIISLEKDMYDQFRNHSLYPKMKCEASNTGRKNSQFIDSQLYENEGEQIMNRERIFIVFDSTERHAGDQMALLQIKKLLKESQDKLIKMNIICVKLITTTIWRSQFENDSPYSFDDREVFEEFDYFSTSSQIIEYLSKKRQICFGVVLHASNIIWLWFMVSEIFFTTQFHMKARNNESHSIDQRKSAKKSENKSKNEFCIVPLLIGVFASLQWSRIIFQKDLKLWQENSEEWLINNQRHQIENLVFGNKQILEMHLRSLYSDISVIQSFYYKLQGGNVLMNPDYVFLECSESFYLNDLCEDYKVALIKKNKFYLNKWYRADRFGLSEMFSLYQEEILISDKLLFYAKVVQNTKADSLLSIDKIDQGYGDSTLVSTVSTIDKFVDIPNSIPDCEVSGVNYYRFDVSCTTWFRKARKAESVRIMEPTTTVDSPDVKMIVAKFFARSFGLTSLSAIGANVQLSNFVSKVLKNPDSKKEDKNSENYNILLHSKSGKLIFHPNWDPSKEINKSLSEVEFQKFTVDMEKDYDEFLTKYKSTFEYCQNSTFAFMDNSANYENFSFNYTKKGVKYVATLLPVESVFLNKDENYFKENPLIIGRVQRDIHYEILEQSLSFDQTYFYFSLVASIMIGIILVGAGIHLFAVLNLSIDYPIFLMTKFLIWEDWNLRQLEVSKVVDLKPLVTDVIQEQHQNIQQSHVFSRFNRMSVYSNKKQTNRQSITKNVINQPPSVVQSNEQLINFSSPIRPSRQDRIDSCVLSSESNQFIITPRKSQSQKKTNANNHTILSSEGKEQFDSKTNLKPKVVSLDDIVSGFKEMDIIVSVFKKMEKVIRSAMTSDVTGDSDSSLISYSTLNQMFRISNNLQSMSNCYTSIGVIFLKKNSYNEATRTFHIALSITLNAWFDIDSIELFESLYCSGTIFSGAKLHVKKLVYVLRLYSLAYLMKAKSIGQFSNEKDQRSYLNNSKKHIKIAQRINNKLSSKDFKESKLISLLLAEIDIELGNYLQAELDLRIIATQISDWDHITSYYHYLLSKLKLCHDKDENISAIILTHLLENSFQLDPFLMQNSLQSISEYIQKSQNIFEDYENYGILKELKTFQEKQFDFTFMVNTEAEEDPSRSTQIIRKIIAEACNNEDTFRFFKINRTGVCEMPAGKFKQKEYIENCLVDISQGAQTQLKAEEKTNSTLTSLMSALIKLWSSNRVMDRGRNGETQFLGKQIESIIIFFDSREYNGISNDLLNEVLSQGEISIIHVSSDVAQIKRISFYGNQIAGEKEKQKNIVDHVQNAKEIVEILHRKRHQQAMFTSMFTSY